MFDTIVDPVILIFEDFYGEKVRIVKSAITHYSPFGSFTRINMQGGVMIEVRESIDQIDSYFDLHENV